MNVRLLTLGLLLPTVSAAATVEVSYSPRRIPHWFPPDSTFLEGSIVATFDASEPVQLEPPDSTVVRVSDTRYTYTFAWNWTAPKTVSFVDGQGQPIVVTATPRPAFPLDLLAHTVPIVHLRTDSTNLWAPDSGIYVWGEHDNCLQDGFEWERPAEIDWYEDGVLAFTREVGLRIFGNTSRRFDQKSLRLYFDGYGTSDEIDYDFFGGSPITFRRILLRTARDPAYFLHTNFVEGIYRDRGHLGSRQAFIVGYVNSEFWGCYNLRERYDEEFIEHTHRLADDDYILLRNSTQVHGDPNVWWTFLESFGDVPDPTSHAWYEDVRRQLDLDTFADWMLLNAFFATADNGFGLNMSHLKVGDEPWRYLMWDEDATFLQPNLYNNHLRFFAAADSAEFVRFLPPETWWTWTSDRQRWCTMFRRLLQNSEFKAFFFARAESLLAGPLSSSALTARLDALVAQHTPEVPRHRDRWSWSPSFAYESRVASLRYWMTIRRTVFVGDLQQFREHVRDPVELSRFDASAATTHVVLDWRTESESGIRGFVVFRSVGDPSAMEPIASWDTLPSLVARGGVGVPAEYTFVDSTAVPNRLNHYQLGHEDLAGTIVMHSWIEAAAPQYWDGVVVNELCAENGTLLADEHGDFDDWIELHNAGPDSIVLEGAYLTDDLAVPGRHRLTGGLVLPPSGHLLLWADGEPLEGDRHLSFRLDHDGEAVGLFRPDGATVVDSVTFGRQFVDRSYGRSPVDGAWSYVYAPTPAAANGDPEIERFLRLNEVLAANDSVIPDGAGDFDPWVEIHNPLPVAIGTGTLTLTDEIGFPAKWGFPDSAIAGEGHLLLWIDAEPAEGPLHASFALARSGGFVALSGASGLIDSVTFAAQGSDTSLARIPDGSGAWRWTSLPTPGAPNREIAPILFVNEFLADNASGIQDEMGEFEDWVELHNPGPSDIPVGGMFLTDDLAETTKWSFPPVSIPAGGFLLVWCDGEPGDGLLHANFGLSKNGEEIGLFASVPQGNGPVDTYVFGPQVPDRSEGRLTDGGLPWVFFDTPTPGASNAAGTSVMALGTYRLQLGPIRPNPFFARTTLGFSVPAAGPAEITIFDVAGRRIRALLGERVPAGPHVVVWDGTDWRGHRAAAGVYYVRLEVPQGRAVKRVVLLR